MCTAVIWDALIAGIFDQFINIGLDIDYYASDSMELFEQSYYQMMLLMDRTERQELQLFRNNVMNMSNERRANEFPYFYLRDMPICDQLFNPYL